MAGTETATAAYTYWHRRPRRAAAVIIASHNHLHSKQPISPSFLPSYLFQTRGYKGPPPACLLLAAFPLHSAYQARALTAPQQYSKPDTSNWRWFSLSLSSILPLWGHSP